MLLIWNGLFAIKLKITNETQYNFRYLIVVLYNEMFKYLLVENIGS